jgi:hypothetical protein
MMYIAGPNLQVEEQWRGVAGSQRRRFLAGSEEEGGAATVGDRVVWQLVFRQLALRQVADRQLAVGQPTVKHFGVWGRTAIKESDAGQGERS